jgi:hypothetical protein
LIYQNVELCKINFFVVSVQVADNAIGRWADTKTGQTVRAQPTERGSEGRVSRR